MWRQCVMWSDWGSDWDGGPIGDTGPIGPGPIGDRSDWGHTPQGGPIGDTHLAVAGSPIGDTHLAVATPRVGRQVRLGTHTSQLLPRDWGHTPRSCGAAGLGGCGRRGGCGRSAMEADRMVDFGHRAV